MRTTRKLEQPRERVFEAALKMIGEHGLDRVTMAALGAELHTSGGHLLYYFGTKDQLLLETLRWSEAGFAADRRAMVERTPDVETVVAYADLYLPVSRADARWLLWIAIWARSPYNPDLAATQEELDSVWRECLREIVGNGVARGTLACADPEGWVSRFLAMLDGYSVGLLSGAVTRASVLEQARELADQLVADGAP